MIDERGILKEQDWWLLLEKGSKTSERTTLFLTALFTGSLKLYFIV